MDLGRAIRIARAARGISQTELARRAGVRASYISMLERGERRNPGVDQVQKFAKALDLPLSLLTLLGAGKDELGMVSASEANRLARALLQALTESPIEES